MGDRGQRYSELSLDVKMWERLEKKLKNGVEKNSVSQNLKTPQTLTSIQRNHETNTKVHPLLRHTPTAPDKIVTTGNMSIEYRRFVDRRFVLPIRVFQQLASKYRGHVSELGRIQRF